MLVKTKHKQVELFVIHLTLAGLAEQFVVEVYLQFWTNVAPHQHIMPLA